MDDAYALKDRIKSKVDTIENSNQGVTQSSPDLKLLRWKALYYKYCRVLGFYNGNSMEKKERLRIVNDMFRIYISSFAIQENEITQVDVNNFEDVVLIAYEILRETRKYDFSVLNPINFYLISMLEFARSKNPNNRNFSILLVKLYDKIGCTT
jgi:hypothetical protein